MANTTPSPEQQPAAVGFPIVGIGASAGGLAAFEAFFSGMPNELEPGMAFVLVQHLAPDHKSILAELVRRYSRMQVFEIEDGMVVQPNQVYIIPPNRDLYFENGCLKLCEPQAPRGLRLPIDYFFRSLAQELRERSIGIILSGTGCDGTLGIRAIKAEGGMAMAQSLETAEYDGMASSAIGTGLVDYQLPPSEMPGRLLTYVAHAFGTLPAQTSSAAPGNDDRMKDILSLLRTQTGHDFSLYKPKTIHRRVERRMAVQQIQRQDEYLRFLAQTPLEVEALFRDFLIGVTTFFRDSEAFKALETTVIPSLFGDKAANGVVRVWCPACSTGEEAYSIAILLQEHLERLKQGFKVQVFATDIDSRAIEHARGGMYPAGIAADVSPERLSRFFTLQPDGGTYRINKGIRDMLIFSEQNILKDPPFSRIDLISCRNLLIYLGIELQKRLIPMFHYALNPGGDLFLGTSETVGDFHDLFATIDRKAKLYQRKATVFRVESPAMNGYMRPAMGPRPGLHGMDAVRSEPRIRLRELTEQALLRHFSATGAIVNERGEILYLHGRTGRYLEPAPGEAAMNIVKMAREGLRLELGNALRQAASAQEPVVSRGIRVKTNGDFSSVDLTVRRIPVKAEAAGAPPVLLVVFEEPPERISENRGDEAQPGQSSEQKSPLADDDPRLCALKKELRIKEESLRTANGELETSNEELRSSNEEMQSINEELQSTNEELETSKEELQSVNEELATVNAELQNKVSDFARANNDMSNLLAGTGVGTIFVDHQLRIKRFTPVVTQVINLILTDVGRPVGHVVSNLAGYDSLVEDIQAVLDSLIPKEVEVRTKKGASYLLRIRPYRTLENVIEGAVITFVDISEIKRAQEKRQEIEEKYQVMFQATPLGIMFLDGEGRIREANPSAERILGLPAEKLLGLFLGDPYWKIVRPNGDLLAPADHPLVQVLRTGGAIQGVILGILAPGPGQTTWIRFSAFVQSRPGEKVPFQVYSTLEVLTGPSGETKEPSR